MVHEEGPSNNVLLSCKSSPYGLFFSGARFPIGHLICGLVDFECLWKRELLLGGVFFDLSAYAYSLVTAYGSWNFVEYGG